MESSTPADEKAARSGVGADSGGERARWWLWPNLLSLDAPLVAVSWLWLMSATLSIRLPEPYWCYGILAASVWVIYVSDRLFDGMAVGDEETLTARHRFYRRRRLPFFVLVLAAAGFAIWAVLHHAPAKLFFYGVVLSFVALFYLLQCAGARMKNPTLNWITILSATSILGILIIQATFLPQWIRIIFLAMTAATGVRLAMERGGHFFQALPKEIFCGVTFAVGVALPVLVWSELALAGVVLLGGLFSLNCIAIALYEQQHDEENDPITIIKNWPRVRLFYPYLVTGLIAVSATIAYLDIGDGTSVLPMAVALGALLLGALHAVSRKMPSGLLRVLSDFVLLLPPAGVFLWKVVSS